jgi:hypothetical protein
MHLASEHRSFESVFAFFMRGIIRGTIATKKAPAMDWSFFHVC